MIKTFNIFQLCLLILIGSSVGCGKDPTPFKIFIFHWDNPSSLGEEITNDLKVLNTDLETSNLVINESEIVMYDWGTNWIQTKCFSQEEVGYGGDFIITLGEEIVSAGEYNTSITPPSFKEVPHITFAIPLELNPEIECGMQLYSYHLDGETIYFANSEFAQEIQNRMREIGKLTP